MADIDFSVTTVSVIPFAESTSRDAYMRQCGTEYRGASLIAGDSPIGEANRHSSTPSIVDTKGA